MLLNITPSGNEFQRKMLLEHSSKVRTIFVIILLLIPVVTFIGNVYSPKKYSNKSSNEFIIEISITGNGPTKNRETVASNEDANDQHNLDG